MKNKFNATFYIGILLLLVAVVYLLDMFGIDYKHFLILTFGTFLMIYACKNKIQLLKYISSVFVVSGIVRIMASFALLGINKPFGYLTAGFILVFIFFYFFSKKKIFILFSATFAFFSIISYINSLVINDNIRYAYYLFSATLLLIIYFVTEHKNIGYTPLGISVVLYLFGTNNLLLGNNIINMLVFKLINIALLVITAISIILISNIKTKNEENEN